MEAALAIRQLGYFYATQGKHAAALEQYYWCDTSPTYNNLMRGRTAYSGVSTARSSPSQLTSLEAAADRNANSHAYMHTPARARARALRSHRAGCAL
jgi:hypothetical protein